MSYKDYIPAGSLEANESAEDFSDFVPEPKPEFVEAPEAELALSEMTKSDLLALAKSRGVKVTTRMSKAHILSAIEEAEE